MKKFKKVLDVLATILLLVATALVILVFVLRLTGTKPKAMGYYLFNVASDSMSPMLEVDDVIVVKQCEASEVHNGDVITYHANSGEMAGKDITHKVIEEPVTDTGGTIRIKTRGIKEGAVTDPIITGDQVIGKYVTKLKIVSLIFAVFKKWYGLLIFLVILFALMGKEMYNLHKLSQKADEIKAVPENNIDGE